MRLIQIITLLLSPIVALAAKKPADVFDTFHKRSVSSSASVKLDDAAYSQLTAAPRDYSLVVLLTALEPRFGCQLCRDFQPEFELLTKSWQRGDKGAESRMLFGTLDFERGKQTFQSLTIQSAPVLLFFHPTVGPNAKLETQPARYDFTTGNQDADIIRNWLSRQLPADAPIPRIVRPINYVKIVSITTAVLGAITFGTVAWPYVLPVVQNRNIWATVSLIAVLLFTSGHMFNHIRKVPYVTPNGKGGLSYFAPGFQNQFGLETQIVAAMYGVLSFATISLALKVPRMSDPKMQQIAVFVWSGVIFGMYSFLLSVFRTKNGGYPFWLPPF